MFGGAHPPAGKFNAGQKMIYWIAVFGGGLISITGLRCCRRSMSWILAACRSPMACTRLRRR